MGQVPNTTTFSLQDVSDAIGDIGVPGSPQTVSSLLQAFNPIIYNEYGFDSQYGDPDTTPNALLEFRNYNHEASVPDLFNSLSYSDIVNSTDDTNNFSIDVLDNQVSWTIEARLGGTFSSTLGSFNTTSGTGDSSSITFTFNTSSNTTNNPQTVSGSFLLEKTGRNDERVQWSFTRANQDEIP